MVVFCVCNPFHYWGNKLALIPSGFVPKKRLFHSKGVRTGMGFARDMEALAVRGLAGFVREVGGVVTVCCDNLLSDTEWKRVLVFYRQGERIGIRCSDKLDQCN